MKALTPEQKQFFSQLEDTFRTPGWQLLINGWKEEQNQLPMQAFFGAKSYEDVEKARVRFGLLNELINLPGITEQQKDNLLNSEEDDPSDG